MTMPLRHPSLVLISAVALIAAMAVAVPQDASAETLGAYVDSVTFTKQDPAAAVGNLIAGDIDMYYLSISKAESQAVRDAGHRVFQSTGGTVYSIYVNPTTDTANGFNPFSLQEARYAINYLVDRGDIIDNVLPSSGTELFSAITPGHPDYDLVQDVLAPLGLRYDPAEADRLFEAALVPAGASKGSDGRWTYGGQPIEITVFVRSDDAVRKSIGDKLVADLGRAGFAAKPVYGDLFDAFRVVYDSNPADQAWHLYTEAWNGFGTVKYDNSRLASYYAPWTERLPGGLEDGLWNYEHAELDRLTQSLYNMEYNSQDERASLVEDAARLAVQESVRVFLVSEHQSYAVRDGVTGVVNAPGSGIANRFTPINAQLPGGDTGLDIGVRHVAQSSWNTVGGLSDSYSTDVWHILSDPGAVRNPHTADLIPARNVYTSVETAGPDGVLAIPPGAVTWDADDREWVGLPSGKGAASKVTIDLRFSEWHHGQPMDMNDIFYAVYLQFEHGLLVDDDPRIPVGLRVPDAGRDTVEVYLDYWHFDEAEIAAVATTWSTLPWEVYAAMEQAVRNNQTHWDGDAALARGVSWLDMLDASDTALIRSHLVALRDTGHASHVPDFLPPGATTAYVDGRYDAAISWIDARGHLAVSNGPFYLDSYSAGSDGAIVEMTVKKYDDPSYPFAAGHWNAFTIDSSQRICR